MSGCIISVVSGKTKDGTDWAVDISGDDAYQGAERVYTIVTYGSVDWRAAFLALARDEFGFAGLRFAEDAAP